MKWSGITALVALVVAVLALYRADREPRFVSQESIFDTGKDKKEETPEVADFMVYLQRYHDKLFWAVREKNKELVAFYIQELGEKMLDVYKSNIWLDGKNLSADMKVYGLSVLDNFRKSADDPESFETHFIQVTEACNACHQAHGKKFIRIKLPETNTWTNQDFKNP